MTAEPSTRTARPGLAEWCTAAMLMLVVAVLARWLSFVPAVIDTDEGLYVVQARAWLTGHWPLIAVWDMHPVGAPALVAGAMALFGQTIAAVRLLGLLSAATTGLALYAMARRLGLPRAVALGAGALYIAMTIRFTGLATNTEILFGPYVVTALALAVGAAMDSIDLRRKPRWRTLFACGLLIGVTLTIKPVTIPEGCFVFAVLVVPAWLLGAHGFGRIVGMAVAYTVACLLPTAAFAAAYAWQGALPIFIDSVFMAPIRYSEGRLKLPAAMWMLAAAAMYLFWPVAFSLLGLLRPGQARRAVVLGFLWFLAATAGVMLPGMYYNHYFLLWLPPLSLLAACGVWSLARYLAPQRWAAVFGVLLAVLATDSWADRAAVRVWEGVGIRCADPVRGVAAALRGVITPGQPVLIANYHPVVYMLADAGLPGRFVFPAQLTGHFGNVAGIDMDDEVARILATRPAAIVVDRGWMKEIRPSVTRLLAEVLEREYTLAATVQEERGPVEIFRPK